MRIKRLLTALLCGSLMVGGMSFPAMADGTKVVTLGADLNEAQRQTMMNYFKANPNEVQIIYVTNQDERNHLGAYVPLEQIGTRTLSCAYVKPTNAGGIRVRTANLNYVTGNMIASTLTTSGVVNCEVIAACPFEVSGTGALTGIQMAYERAVGVQLDPAKKNVAAQEIVVTGNVASEVGNNNATMLVNNAKMEVLQNNVQNTQEIYNIVNNICVENNINITQNNMVQVVDLLSEISALDYDYEEISSTLESVTNNVSQISDISENNGEKSEDVVEAVMQAGIEEPEEYDEDSILNDIDETALGENIPTSSTDDPTLEADTYDPAVEMGEAAAEEASAADAVDQSFDEYGIPAGEEYVVNPDGTETAVTEPQAPAEESPAETYTEYPEETFPAEADSPEPNPEEAAAQEPEWNEQTWEEPSQLPAENPENPEGNTEESAGADQTGAAPAEVPADQGEAKAVIPGTLSETERAELTAKLTEQTKEQYKNALAFAGIEFEKSMEAAPAVLGSGYTPAYQVEDAELARSISKAITDQYLTVLANGTDSFFPDGTEKYMSTALNMMDRYLKNLFETGETAGFPDANDPLNAISASDKELLYKDCIGFFEKLYGESQQAQAPAEQPQEQPQEQQYAAEEQQYEQPQYEEQQYEQPAEYTEQYTDYSYSDEGGYSEDGYSGEESYYIPEGEEAGY